MAHENINDKIDAYLANALPPDEMRAFKKEIDRDPALAAEVELHEMELEAMDEMRRDGIRSRIPDWRETMAELPAPPFEVVKAPVVRLFSKRILPWAIAAALLPLILGAFWLFVIKEKKKPDLVENNSKPTPSTLPAFEKPNAPIAEVPKKPATETNPAPVKKDNQLAVGTPKPETPKQPPVKKMAEPSIVFEEKYAALPEAASENLGDLYAYVEEDLVGASRGMSDRPETKALFEEARLEFSKPDRNTNLLKTKLLSIPPDDKFYRPLAMKMLAEVYFKDKDYHMAVWAYEKYAALDPSSATKWRLLNFRLADLPNGKAEFWRLLNDFAEKGDEGYRAKALKLKDGLVQKGISE